MPTKPLPHYPERKDMAWPPPPQGFVLTPEYRAMQKAFQHLPGTNQGPRMPVPHPLQITEKRSKAGQFLMADGSPMGGRNPAFSISLWTGQTLIATAAGSLVINFFKSYIPNALQPPRVRRSMAMSAAVKNVSKTAPRCAFMVFSLLSTFSAARFITRYRNDGVMVEPLIGFFGGLYFSRRIKITSPIILRSGVVTGGSPFLIPFLFGSFGALFGYWFVHGTGYVIGDPNERISLPDPREHDYVFGPAETTFRFARWEQLRAEAASQPTSFLPRAASPSGANDKWD